MELIVDNFIGLPFYATAATALDQHFPNMFDKLFQLNSK